MYVLTYAGNTIHDPREEGVQISAGKLVEESGQSPTLSFTVQPTHPLWRAFNRESVMNTEREIELTEHETQKILFRGRIRKVSMSMNGSIDVTCEGAMAYLNDTTVRPYKTYDTNEIDCEINAPAKAGELFEWFIEQHNSRVSNRCKKFKVGINAGVNFGALQRGTGTRPTTLKEMREKLTKLCGEYFRVRYVGEDNYLDWLNADGSSEAAQSVELGQNLLDLNTGADGKDIYTAIVPVGKTGEGEDEKDVTIDDEHAYAGGGYDIVGDAVVDTAMAERYGVIEKLMEYDHLNQPQALADKAVADLAAGKLSDSITVSATDLHYADAAVQQIDYLQRVQVTSEPHGIDRMMLCVGRTINLVDPKATRYSFGAIEGTLTKSGTTSQERTQEATEKRLTALASTTRKTVEDTHKIINDKGLQIFKNFISNNYTKIDDLIKLIKFTGWTTLQDDGVCRVRYCIRGGMLYLDCYLAAGYSARTTTAEMPDNLLPAIEGYYPMGTETGDHTAKIWIGAAGGGNKRIYLYNNSSGYATGIIPILPKSLE